MKFKLSFLLLLLLTSCIDLDQEDEAKYSEWEYEKVPLNDKELRLIDSLKTIGFYAYIDHYYIGRGSASESYDIRLDCDTLLVSRENYLELNELQNEVVNKLYNSIIEDSVLFAIKKIDFSFKTQQYVRDERDGKTMKIYKSGLSSEEFSGGRDFMIKDLAKKNGFRVVKIKSNVYKRVKY